MSYTDDLMATDPVAYLLLSADATDSSGNSHNGTSVGTGLTFGEPGLIDWETDGSVTMAGSGSVSMPNLSLTHPFSLCWVISPTGDAGTTTGYATLAGYGTTKRILWADSTHGESILVQMGGGNLSSAANSVPPGELAHIAYTADGTTEKLYVNGTLAVSQANAAAAWSSAFWVGAYAAPGGAYVFEGGMEKFSVHNTCLSAATIATLSADALSPPPPPSGVSLFTWNGSAYVPAANLEIYVGGDDAPAPTADSAVWLKTS